MIAKKLVLIMLLDIYLLFNFLPYFWPPSNIWRSHNDTSIEIYSVTICNLFEIFKSLFCFK